MTAAVCGLYQQNSSGNLEPCGSMVSGKKLRGQEKHIMKQEQIDRINELYHKSQAVGLTDEEKEEQAALRKQYVADIKASLRGHLNNISIVEKDGSVTDLGKKYGNVGKTES